MAPHRPIAGRRLSRQMRTVFQGITNGLRPATYTAFHKTTIEEPVFVGGYPVLNENGTPKTLVKPAIRREQHAVNHFRRLKRAWRRHGIEGYNAYLKSVGSRALFPQA